MNNWTDWTASSGKAARSGRWTAVGGGSRFGLTTPGYLQVSSQNESNALLFYTPFGAGDFTYTAGVTFDAFTTKAGQHSQAGLSLRLSDNMPMLDAGGHGYDVVLTNRHSGKFKGSVELLKRAPLAKGGHFFEALQSAGFDVATAQTYQLSVTTQTAWTAPAYSIAPLFPPYPSSTTFKVSVNGKLLLTFTDETSNFSMPAFSGRFGVNASYANAHFTCIQANDGPMPPPCPQLWQPPHIGPLKP
jgi:hypothetical protein